MGRKVNWRYGGIKMVKFKNPCNHVISFNVAKVTSGGGIKNKWLHIAKGAIIDLTDPFEIECARKQDKFNRIQNELKGYLEEVTADIKAAVERPKVPEAPKSVEQPVRARGRPPAVHI